ncbi:MAG: acetyl-CoA C-acetyltransferase, partial [Arenicella sp.]
KPAFSKDGTLTAANSSSISDGAAALVLASGGQLEAKSLSPIAKICGYVSHAQAPEEFTLAPIGAINKLLAKLNWTVDDVDLFEVNEAFAVVTLLAMKEVGISHDKVNIHGGACALGHPLGASGARIIVTLIHALRRVGKTRGIASLCIGGGEATAIAIELV